MLSLSHKFSQKGVKSYDRKKKQNQSIFAPYLKHRGRTVEEQIKLNQPAMEWLKKRLEEEITEEEAKTRQEDLERFKQIVDSF